jgi:hypothetical protein
MKRILPILVALLTAPALAAGPVKDADLPDIFKKEPPFIQNQVCGELMAGIARMSANLYLASGNAPMKDAAIMSGTRALLFMKATATLSADEQARAKRIALNIESTRSPTNPAMTPLRFCEDRAKRWMRDGVVTEGDVKLTESEVRAAINTLKPLKKP